MGKKKYFFIVLIIILLSRFVFMHCNSRNIKHKNKLEDQSQSSVHNQKLSIAKIEKIDDIFIVLNKGIRKVMNFFMSSKSDQMFLEVIKQMGLISWNSGEINMSEKYFKKGLLLAEKTKCDPEILFNNMTLNMINNFNQGVLARKQGNYNKSFFYLQKANIIARKTGVQGFMVKCLRQLSITCWKLNDLNSFSYFNRQALKIAQSLGLEREISKCLINEGVYNRKIHKFIDSMSCYEKALQISRRNRILEDEAACLNNMGIIYENLGQYEKALDYLKQSIIIDRKIGNVEYLAMDINNLGEIYRNRGQDFGSHEDFRKAYMMFNKALALSEKTESESSSIPILNNLGLVLIDLKKYREAKYFFEIGYKSAKKIGFVEAICNIKNNEGRLNIQNKNYYEAIINYQEAIKYSLIEKRYEILWEAYYGLGFCYEMTSRQNKAIEYYEKSIDIIELMRKKIPLDAYKNGFVRNKQKVYEAFVRLLYEQYRNKHQDLVGKKIFKAIERAKASAFLESLEENLEVIEKGIGPDLEAQEKNITDEITGLIKKIEKMDYLQNSRQLLMDKLHRKEEEYMRLTARMRSVSHNEKIEFIKDLPSIIDVQQKICDENTVLISFSIIRDIAIVFLINQKQFFCYSINDWQSVEKKICNYVRLVSQPPSGDFLGKKAGLIIFNSLFSKARDILTDKVNRLIIIPEGLLYELPFEILVNSFPTSKFRNEFLVHQHKISYAPSVSVLMTLINKVFPERRSERLFALGNPSANESVKVLFNSIERNNILTSSLPWSEKEIRIISEFFSKKNITVNLGKKATETVLKQVNLSNYSFIHFACHSVLNKKYPLRSALILAPDKNEGEDGLLQVREIYNLKLKAELVVLSSCRTRTGKFEKNEGNFGFSSVFLHAGARSVVASLWQVNDSITSFFMKKFYHFLKIGRSKIQALRLAKLFLIKSSLSHPFYWGAFVLSGEADTRFKF